METETGLRHIEKPKKRRKLDTSTWLYCEPRSAFEIDSLKDSHGIETEVHVSDVLKRHGKTGTYWKE